MSFKSCGLGSMVLRHSIINNEHHRLLDSSIIVHLKKSVTLVASGGVLVEAGQRDQLSATFSCNSTKSYQIVSCNKSIATWTDVSTFEKLDIRVLVFLHLTDLILRTLPERNQPIT